MDTKIILILAAISVFVICTTQSNFGNVNGPAPGNPEGNASVQGIDDVYKNCSFTYENRPFPSGNIPGSYLGLSTQERATLLKRFVEYKNEEDLDYEKIDLNN
jgi:hypothetical protein